MAVNILLHIIFQSTNILFQINTFSFSVLKRIFHTRNDERVTSKIFCFSLPFFSFFLYSFSLSLASRSIRFFHSVENPCTSNACTLHSHTCQWFTHKRPRAHSHTKYTYSCTVEMRHSLWLLNNIIECNSLNKIKKKRFNKISLMRVYALFSLRSFLHVVVSLFSLSLFRIGKWVAQH